MVSVRVIFFFNFSLFFYILGAFFNKTVIPLALVACEIRDSQQGAEARVK